MRKIFNLVFVAFALGLASRVNATLLDRGGGLVYDNILNVTWLKDANYVDSLGYDDSTYGYDTNGQLQWTDALAWVDGLTYAGYSDWRLPTALNQDGTGPCFGYNCTNSEFGYLYYEALHNLGVHNPDDGSYQPDWGLSNVGPFDNLQPYFYWTGTEIVPGVETEPAWYFTFCDGEQSTFAKHIYLNVTAVRDGDVSQVPIPAAIWFLGTGLIAIVGMKRFKNK